MTDPHAPFPKPVQQKALERQRGGGPLTPDNCVILCRACHLSAHQGGRFADVSIYDDLKSLTMPAKIARIAALYPHYRG